jgi:hypothetical protein
MFLACWLVIPALVLNLKTYYHTIRDSITAEAGTLSTFHHYQRRIRGEYMAHTPLINN